MRAAPARTGGALCRPTSRTTQRAAGIRPAGVGSFQSANRESLYRRGVMSKVVELHTPPGTSGARAFWSLCAAVVFLALFVHACVVVQARPEDLLTGAPGMADIVSPAIPPASH